MNSDLHTPGQQSHQACLALQTRVGLPGTLADALSLPQLVCTGVGLCKLGHRAGLCSFPIYKMGVTRDPSPW